MPWAPAEYWIFVRSVLPRV